MRKYTDPTQYSTAEWEAMAAQCAQRSQESRERSDTDGALTQWANDSLAIFYRDVAAVATNGGRHRIPWLFDAATGLPLDEWRWLQGRYGSSVAVGDRDNTVWFHPSQARDAVRCEANDRAKGFVWGVVECGVVLYQFGTTVLQNSYERKRGTEITVITHR